METKSALGWLAGAFLVSKVLGKKSSSGDVINNMPANKQADALWYAQQADAWYKTGTNKEGVLYWVQHNESKDNMVKFVINAIDTAPSSRAQEQSSAWTLTMVDKYNIISQKIEEFIKLSTGMSSPLTAFDKKQVAFIQWLGAYIAYEFSKGGDQKFGDMGYVRFANRFNLDGSKNCVRDDSGSCLMNPLNGEVIYKGTYADMKNYIIYNAVVSKTTAGLTDGQMESLIMKFIKSAGQWGTIGQDGPTSTYWSSLIGSLDWQGIENALKWVYNQFVKEDSDEETKALLDSLNAE